MNRQMARRLSSLLPQLSTKNRKGDNGRIGVIGGSFEFTGAPYFTAMSALKSGADMAHIFCAKSAAVPIKSYSPEIIVHPVFTLSTDLEHSVTQNELEKMHNQWLDRINAWKPAITGWVIGPGLGRDKHMDTFFPKLVKSFNKDSLIVFDADGIFYLCQYPQLLDELGKNYRVILTPNHKQLTYLRRHLKFECQGKAAHQQNEEDIVLLKDCYYNYDFNILAKGEHDYYLTKNGSYRVTAKGGLTRCGGLGDLVAGATIACASWSYDYGPLLACWTVKKATRAAFLKERRGMTAPTVLAEICPTFMSVQEEMLRSTKE